MHSNDQRENKTRPVRRMTLTIETEAGPGLVTFSPGVERFIGRYPRVKGLCPPGQLLHFGAREG